MKRKRGARVCVVEMGPLGTQSFGVPTGGTKEEVAKVVATIENENLSMDTVVERYNRRIQIKYYDVADGTAEPVVYGIEIGLLLKRVPSNKNTYYVLDGSLVEQARVEAMLDASTSEESSESEELPTRVVQNSDSAEEIDTSDFSESAEEIDASESNEDDPDYLSSGETSDE